MATVLSEWPKRFASQNDLNNLRDDCVDNDKAREEQAKANHRELLDAIKAHYPGEETRQYIAVKTNAVEQEMQVVAESRAAPLWQQLWNYIAGNKWRSLVALVLAGALVRGLIEFLTQLLILINNTTSHVLH